MQGLQLSQCTQSTGPPITWILVDPSDQRGLIVPNIYCFPGGFSSLLIFDPPEL